MYHIIYHIGLTSSSGISVLQICKVRIFKVLLILQLPMPLICEASCLHDIHKGDNKGQSVDTSECHEACRDAKAAIDQGGDLSGEEDRDKVAEGAGCVHKCLQKSGNKWNIIFYYF